MLARGANFPCDDLDPVEPHGLPDFVQYQLAIQQLHTVLGLRFRIGAKLKLHFPSVCFLADQLDSDAMYMSAFGYVR
jgi:hypothetical protein